LRDMWGTPSGEMWAAGAFGVVIRHDGEGWRSLHEDPAQEFLSISVGGDGTRWAVGFAGLTADLSGTPGAPGWLLVPPALSQGLNDVWVIDADHAWTVGFQGVVYGRSGGTWSAEVAASATNEALRAVWGADADHLWAVGDGGTILRYDTGAWTEHPGSGGGTGPDLYGVGGTSDQDVWAVGDGGMARHWNGTAWSDVPTGNADRLRGVWASSPTDVWIVGNGGVILHYDGSTFTAHPIPVSRTLHDVWGSGPSDVWAVGNGGAAAHYNGSSWSVISAFTTLALRGVSGTGPNDVWAVGPGQVMQLPQRYPRGGGGDCRDPIPIYCETTLTGSTAGGTDVIAGGSCGAPATAGPETFYELRQAVTGSATITLTPTGGDAALYVLDPDPDGGCDLAACTAASPATGPEGQELVLQAQQGDRLYLAVDSITATPATFTIAVTCVKEI